MSNYPWFSAGIADRAFPPVTGVPGSKLANTVPEDSAAEGFIESDPMLDPGAHRLKHDSSIVDKVGHELLLVQEPTIPLLKLIGKIPVEESDERHDAGREQVIGELDIVVQSRLVDRIRSTSQRNDSRPGNGEAICFGTGLLEQFDVLGCSMIRVTGDISRAAVSDLAGDLAEGVPY